MFALQFTRTLIVITSVLLCITLNTINKFGFDIIQPKRYINVAASFFHYCVRVVVESCEGSFATVTNDPASAALQHISQLSVHFPDHLTSASSSLRILAYSYIQK